MSILHKNKVIFNIINNNNIYCFNYVFSLYSSKIQNLQHKLTTVNSMKHNGDIYNDVIINNFIIKDKLNHNNYFKILDFNIMLKKEKKYNYYNIYTDKSNNIENEFNVLKCNPNIHCYININDGDYINNKKIVQSLMYYGLF